MRRFLIAGNWKMNLLRDSSLQLVHQLLDTLHPSSSVEVAIMPPSVYLHDVGAALRGSHIGLGAQNLYHQDEGAFTGEISGKMLKDLGCSYVILGHSERRQYFAETDGTVNQKTLASFKYGLTPIVCVGETLEERESDRTSTVIETQVRGSLANLTPEQMESTVVAYEPVWAIGTGRTASPEQAEEVHLHIRSLLTDMFGGDTAHRVRIQYGGSVKADNALELLGKPNIDGALVGGASLKADSFGAIVEAAKKAKPSAYA